MVIGVAGLNACTVTVIDSSESCRAIVLYWQVDLDYRLVRGQSAHMLALTHFSIHYWPTGFYCVIIQIGMGRGLFYTYCTPYNSYVAPLGYMFVNVAGDLASCQRQYLFHLSIQSTSSHVHR